MAEMKAGYKQTDISVIPEDWDVMPLYQLCDQNNGLVRGPFGGALKKEFFSNNGYKVYTQQNAIYQDEDLGNYYIPVSKYKELSRFAIRPNDFIVSCSGTIGKIHKVSANSEQGVINQALLIIRTNEKITKEFFSFYFRSKKFQSLIIDSTQGGAMQNLVGMSVFKETPIIVPEIEEQKQIAAALSDVDGLIESLEQLITKKRDMKTATMQQLLTGKNRLPGFNGEWGIPALEDLADFFKGKLLPKSAISDSGKFSCIHYGELFTHYPEKIKSIRFKTNQPINTSFLSKVNDVLMPTSDVTINGLAKASCISQDNVILGGDILVIRPKKLSELNGVFLSYFIRFHKDEIMKRASGTTVYHLYASDIKNLPVDLPGIEEQDAIVSVLEDMDKEINALEQHLEKARSLKTGIMQELLTGKTRLIKTDKKQKVA